MENKMKPTRDQLVDDLLSFLREIQLEGHTDPFLKEEAARLEDRMIGAIASGVIE
jgi:hypothetical protein